MYCDLCIKYDNPGNKDKEKFQEFCELLCSAISDGYCVFGINSFKKGTLGKTEFAKYEEVDLEQIYKNYSLKFLNTKSSMLVNFSQIKQLKRLTVELSETKDLYQFSNPHEALRSYDLVGVLPKTEKIFDLCLTELTCDFVIINFEEKINFAVKKHLIAAAIERNVFFEIQYSDFIKNSDKRSTFISNALLLFDVTKGKNIMISSGGETFLEHRSPKEIMVVFETIFKVDADTLKATLTDNCAKIIKKSILRKYYKTTVTLEKENDKMEIDK